MSNQTIDGVPRALLERIKERLDLRSEFDPTYPPETKALNEDALLLLELRALLDAERCTSCDGSGDLIDLTGEWRGYCICPAGVALKSKPSAQPQGEPVAYRYKRAHESWASENPWEPTTLAHGASLLERKALAMDGTLKGDEQAHYLALLVEPLYTEQPAPVAFPGYPPVPEDRKLAAPVAVVMPNDKTVTMSRELNMDSKIESDEIHQMAFEEGRPAENGDGYLFTSEEFDLFVERLLYRAAPVVEQPLPVAVVLPERLDLPHRDEFESADQYAAATGEAKKWNSCLDEVTRLNTK